MLSEDSNPGQLGGICTQTDQLDYGGPKACKLNIIPASDTYIVIRDNILNTLLIFLTSSDKCSTSRSRILNVNVAQVLIIIIIAINLS